MKHYILYSSKECCLCDDAMGILNEFGAGKRFHVEKVDIYKDKSLLIKYRVRIPVLKDEENGRELGWPFTLSSLSDWIAELEL